jgi:hypothetical protein
MMIMPWKALASGESGNGAAAVVSRKWLKLLGIISAAFGPKASVGAPGVDRAMRTN